MNEIYLKLLIIVLLGGFGLLITKEISYYKKGWGLNFHILDLKEQDGWVKPFPNKLERLWLLITIIIEIVLLFVLAIPSVLFLSSR